MPLALSASLWGRKFLPASMLGRDVEVFPDTAKQSG